jgi:hypothetical protein
VAHSTFCTSLVLLATCAYKGYATSKTTQAAYAHRSHATSMWALGVRSAQSIGTA